MPEANKSTSAGGDAPSKDEKKTKGKVSPQDDNKGGKFSPQDEKKGMDPQQEENKTKGKIQEILDIDEMEKSPEQIARLEEEHRTLLRRQRFKRRWPEVTKVPLKTRPWHPPGPPPKMPKIEIALPPLELKQWVPPYRRRRRRRPHLPRIPAEEMTKPLYDYSKLKKIWHSFWQVEKNKMMLQGHIACNSKAYPATTCGAQTACIAVVCRAVLEDKTPAQLVRRDVDDIIEEGDKYYRQSLLAMKCYKGKPQLELDQLLTSFFVHDCKYLIKMTPIETGILAKHPDNVDGEGLIEIMDKRIGTTYMFILSIGTQRHFLVWGHPPTEGGSSVKTICYIFDPHMLDQTGCPHKLYGAGAFLRYAGVSSFVVDFLSNYGDLHAVKNGARTPTITLTNVEVLTKEMLDRSANFDLDLNALKIHCRSEWESINMNLLIEQKRKGGKHPLASLSAVSLATSKADMKKQVRSFYQRQTEVSTKETPPVLPMVQDRGPAAPTTEALMQMRGEDFFLYCPRTDGYSYGRDDLVPFQKSETIIHSPVEKADKAFTSQYQQVDVGKWILRATRHFGSHRYQKFKSYTGVACCVMALSALRRMRARGWNEDTLDETLDLGYNLYRESLLERGGPIRRLVLGELKETFVVRDKDYIHKDKGIFVWGKLLSGNPKVFNLCKGIDAFFKESDAGLLQMVLSNSIPKEINLKERQQNKKLVKSPLEEVKANSNKENVTVKPNPLVIPGEYEVAIWNEGGRYYVYHPWPADRYGKRVGLREGGKACLLYFTSVSRLCEHLLESCADLRKKPFSISDIVIRERGRMPEQINKLKPVASNRWVIRGSFNEGDERFPEQHRNKQATPTAICAIALSHVVPSTEWTSKDIDEVLIRGDILYQATMENLEKRGVSLEKPRADEAEAGGEEEAEEDSGGKLGAHDVLNRFRISEFESIETDLYDGYGGHLTPAPDSGLVSLKDSLAEMFRHYSHGVVTARGVSTAVWLNRNDRCYYYFDPHGCDEEGISSSDSRAGACLVRIKGGAKELADVILGNLPPGDNNSFDICPVAVTVTRLNTELGAPETTLENQQFEWISKGTAAILMGPRGENTAIGKAAARAGVPPDDMSGRTIALPAAAAFAAASAAVPPPHMHQDHMFNFLDAGAEYYLNHVKKTGRKEIKVEDLTEKFEMGANTFSIELDKPIQLPLRLPDEPKGEGGEEEAAGDDEVGEEEIGDVIKEKPPKQIKEALFMKWYDNTAPTSISLLIGDYHQMGVWMAAGGEVVVFDPAPTLAKGRLTPQRIKKGDELRMQRIKDEMVGEAADEEEDEDEPGAEGEEQPALPLPEFVPPESCPAIMVFATPGEFIDKLTLYGGLDRKQCLAPYKLYAVKITNELTSMLKEKKPREEVGEDEAGDEEEGEQLVDPLSDEAIGKYFNRVSRTVASLRGNLAQDDNFFMDKPNRNNQDAATAIMGIVVDHIEPYKEWKPSLIDVIIKYGDRLYTLSLTNARLPPHVSVSEVHKEFHVTNFNVKLDVELNAVTGDIKAGRSGNVLSIERGLTNFFQTYNHGVFCAKNYCVGIWRGADGNAVCLWEPHACGPTGQQRPGGAAGLTLFSTVRQMAETMRGSIRGPGDSGFSISPVKVFWEISQIVNKVTPQGTVPEEGYEWKVLTAFVQIANGRSILRGTPQPEVVKFSQDALMQSSCGAIVSVCMAHVRRPHLWTRRTVDEVMSIAGQLFEVSVSSLGFEFDGLLMPLQVLNRFVLGTNYVKYDLDSVYTGRLEQKEPNGMTFRAALERFFSLYKHGIVWSSGTAVGIWRVDGAPAFYMMEPHACGPMGLRNDVHDKAAACVVTFTSAKLMAYAYLQNIPEGERTKHEFTIYSMSVSMLPIKPMGAEPPLVMSPSGRPVVPATSRVDTSGRKRHADESSRKDGEAFMMMVTDIDPDQVRGQRKNGWLVLPDGSRFLSAQHSIACRKFPYSTRNKQALSCSIMAVAMSGVQDVCIWKRGVLDAVLDSGTQLYQDSVLHYKPGDKPLTIQQVLRKFYTPGNCVCRVTVFQPRQKGSVNSDLNEQMTQFFKEEKVGVFVAGKGDFAVALFKTPRGYCMFDPMDRDAYGRAVAPVYIGHASACFSQYPTVDALCKKLAPNVPPVMVKPESTDKDKKKGESTDNKEDNDHEGTKEPAKFAIYGMEVSSLRKLKPNES